jgi:hypothetical protein
MKRFGRNQRRRMRERVDALEHAHEMDRGLLAYQSGRLRALDDEIESAKRMVGQHCALFGPGSLRLPGRSRGHIEMLPPAEPASFLNFDAMEWAQTVGTIPLTLLLSEVGERSFDGSLHVRVRFGDDTWAYGITRMAARSMPTRDLVQRIAEELAHMIGPALQKELRP